MPISNLSRGPRVTYDASIGSALTRGPRRSRLLNSAGWVNNWPAPESTLDIDFVNDRAWVKGLGVTSATAPFTFTRASTGTFVGPDGLLKGAGSHQGALGQNLLTFPQNFENAVWNKSTTGMVTPDSIQAYDGTNTGDILNIPSTGANINRSQTAGTYTLSIFVRPYPSTSFRLQFSTSSLGRYADFTLTGDGSVSTVGALGGGSGTVSGGTASIDPPVNGWYRCVLRNVTLSGTNNIIFTTATGTATFGIWGAQLETNATETPYFPTNYGQWRFDWGNQQYSRTNLFTYTEQFDNGAWTKTAGQFQAFGSGSGFSIANTSLTTDPLGGNTADLLVLSTSPGSHRIYQGIPTYVGQTNTFSVYVKKQAGSTVRWLRIDSDTTATMSIGAVWFDLDNGVYGTVSPRITAYTPENAGNGWYRISYSYTSTIEDLTDNHFIAVATADGSTSNYTGDGLTGYFIWGAQIEASLLPSTNAPPSAYQAVGASVPFTLPLRANPTVNGVLMERVSTNNTVWCRDATQSGQNFITYSEQFDQSVWGATSNGLTVSPNVVATTDPLGTNTADKLVETSTTGVHCVIQAMTGGSSVTPYTSSIYLKAAERTLAEVWVINTGQTIGSGIRVDLSTGQFVSSRSVGGSTLQNYTITSVGNGWWRVSVTALTGNTSVALLASPILTGTGTSTLSYTGVADNGIYAWGAQLEGSNNPTGYQQTVASAIALGWNKFNCTAVKNQAGIDGVPNSCTQLTATGANATCIQNFAGAAGNRNSSVYLKRVSGSGKIKFSVDGGLTWSDIQLSSTEWRRFYSQAQTANSSVGILIETSGDVIAMDYAQNEGLSGLDPTSPILTTTAAVTRSGDLATLQGSPWLDRKAGTFRADVTSYSLYQRNQGTFFYVTDNSLAGIINSFTVQCTSTNLTVSTYTAGVGGGVSSALSHNNVRDKTQLKFAVSYGQEFFEIAYDGVSQGTVSALSTYGSRGYGRFGGNQYLSTFVIGGTGIGALTSCIKSITYVPRAYQTNQLIEMTRLT